MPLILPGNVATELGAGYEVANSCLFNDDDTAYMHRTPGSAGNQKKWTFSCWFKRGNLGAQASEMRIFGGNANASHIYLTSGDLLRWDIADDGSGSGDAALGPSMLFRDIASWYHIVCALDTDHATANNRMRIYVNGTEITDFATRSNPDSGHATNSMNDDTMHTIGYRHANQGSAGMEFDGYLAEVVFIDGQQYAASSFGEFDSDSPNIWKPIDVSGLTFGTNGFYLDFEDSGDLDDDESGNGNDWTAVNLASTDQMLDSPTNNFCVLNNLEAETATTSYAQGNLAGTTSNAARSTFAVNKGKWYWEHRFVNKEDMGGVMAYAKTDGSSWFAPNAYTINALIQGSNPELVLNGTEQSSWSGDGTPDALVDNDILNVALDCDNNRIAFGVNGAWLDNLDGSGEWNGTTLNYSSITAGYDYSPCFRTGSGTNRESHMNFGSPFYTISSGNADANGYGNFEYAVPSGFFALCSKNLAEYG